MKYYLTVLLLLAGIGCSAEQNKEPILLLDVDDLFSESTQKELAKAAESGSLIKIDEAINRGAKANARGRYGLTALFCAARRKNIDGFIRLLERGADPNMLWDTGNSVMHWVSGVEDGRFLTAALSHKGNPNLINSKSGETPLFRAVSPRGKVNLKALVSAGANLNHRNRNGMTAVMVAADLNQFDVVYTLLQNGADYTVKDNWGNTLVFAIEENNIDENSELFMWRQKVIGLLLEKGMEVNIKN